MGWAPARGHARTALDLPRRGWKVAWFLRYEDLPIPALRLPEAIAKALPWLLGRRTARERLWEEAS